MTTTRDQVACMMRIRNEDRWIRQSLEQTFKIAKTVVILDDGSDDETEAECDRAVGDVFDAQGTGTITLDSGRGKDGQENVLHYIHSPFRPAVRETQAVSEIRDKNFLWEYCKSKVNFEVMLCLDGDEVLSKDFIKDFPTCLMHMENQVDVMTVPFLYLWDDDHQIRVDGIYGNLQDGSPRLRFPRVFTIKRISADQLHIMRFSWEGSKGGFHCGSIPRENFRPDGKEFVGAFYARPVIHYGYRDELDRQRKYVFYNKIDPGNKFEGEYKHVIGKPNIHAPGPVEFRVWSED